MKLGKECPNCKVWGYLDGYKKCPDCGFKFTRKIRKEMKQKAIREEVYDFASRYLESLWRVLECFIEDHTLFTERDKAFNEAFIRECQKFTNSNPNEFDAEDLYIRKVNYKDITKDRKRGIMR